MQMFRLLWQTISVVIILGIVGCMEEITPTSNEEYNGVIQQALDSAHTRVVQEASQAMSGSWSTYDATNWPTGTNYGSYAYISNDTGAWGKLLDNTYNGSVRGWWTSCRRTSSVQNFTPCSITAYGDLDTASQYDCQGTCAGGINHRGGQCKSFMNLVAYRSGLYQNPNYAWKSFPNDTSIDSWSTASGQMPYATFANVTEGDYLRRTTSTGSPHALIVVRKISPSTLIVLDSNYMNPDGGNGNGLEIIATHQMQFTGAGGITDLGTYRVLQCAYNGNC